MSLVKLSWIPTLWFSVELAHLSGCSDSSSGMVASCFSPGLVVKASKVKGLERRPAMAE